MNTIVDNLVLHLKLDKLQANLVPDSSRSQKNGTGQGGVSLAPDAQFGSCLQFDGADDRVTIDPETFRSVTNTFTMSAWVIPTTTQEIDAQSTGGASGTGGQKFVIYPVQGDATYGAGQGHAGAGISVGTNGISVYEHAANYMPPLLVWQKPANNPALTANRWTHIAVVYQNKTPSLYVDGQLVATGSSSTKSLIHPSGEIGGGHWGYFAGKLANIRVYQRALSTAEVQQVVDTDRVRKKPLTFPRQQGWESKMCAALGLIDVASTYPGLTPFQKAIGTMGLDAAEAYFLATNQPDSTPDQVITRLQVANSPLPDFSQLNPFTGVIERPLPDKSLRDSIIGLIVAQIIAKLKLNQNDAESNALRDWAIPIFRQMRVDVAVGTLEEYKLWKANPCTYSAPGYQKPQSCHRVVGHNPYNSMWQVETPPSDLLLKAGLAYAAGKNDEIVKGISAGIGTIGLVGGFLAASTGIGVATSFSYPLINLTITTSLYAAFGGTGFGGATSAVASIGAMGWAGVIAGPAAVIVAATMIGVSQGIAVVQAAQVEFKLKQAISAAMNENINIANVIADENLNALLLIGMIKSANDRWKTPSLAINGEVILFCEAGYVAKFYLTYTLNGQPKSFTTGDVSLGFWQKFDIPADAQNIEVRGVMLAAGEHQIFRETLPRPTFTSYKVYGTAFQSAWNRDWPMSVSGEISSTAGELKFTHAAGFVAKWEITYDLINKPNQSISSGDTSLGWKKTYNIPLDATNVRILVQGATGLAKEPWRTTYDKTFPSAPNLCLKIFGTTLNQQWNNDCN